MKIPALGLLCSVVVSITATATAPEEQIALIAPRRNIEITNRGDADEVLQIQSVEVNPNPVEVGSTYTSTINGTLTAALQKGASFDMTIHLGLVKLLVKQYDLCDNDWIKLDCPVEKGPVSWTTEETTLSAAMPLAKYKIQLVGYTVDDDDDLFNLEVAADLMKKRAGLKEGL